MILLDKAVTNNVSLTLTELTTISNPTYLFVFTNDTSNGEFICIAADLSSYKYRANKFLMTFSATPNALLGQLSTSMMSGFYHYKVYAQTSPTNLDPTLANEVVELGKMKIADVTATSYTYEYNGNEAVVYPNFN